MAENETVGAEAPNTSGRGPAAPAAMVLPEPRITGGKSLMDAIAARCSTRKYGPKPPSPQELSDILWAASGLTREYAGTGIRSTGSHAAPAAHNWQEVDLFVATQDGVYLYDPLKHALEGVLAEDIRYLTAHEEQPFVLDVPVILIYVADVARMTDASERDKGIFPWADSAVMAQNVYLYCASAGLATVLRALFSRRPLAQAMGLRPDQVITFSQPVGYAG